MFKNYEDGPTKRITFACRGADDLDITVSKDFHEDTTWREIAVLFWQFLQAQGFILQMEDVGGEL